MEVALASVRVATLNIRHGGGERVAQLARALLRHDADVLVLTEYRDGASGQLLGKLLHEAGFKHQLDSAPPAKVNGVLLASRRPARGRDVTLPSRARMVEALVDDVWIGGVYFPGTPRRIASFWKTEFMSVALERRGERSLLIGDFNSGKHLVDEERSTLTGHPYVCEMEASGWTDAWRSLHPGKRDYTWVSHRGNGFRLDHAWLSPQLGQHLRGASHSHAERDRALTDHSALIVDLSG